MTSAKPRQGASRAPDLAVVVPLGRPRPASEPPPLERLLTVAEVAAILGTTERFPRRLIAERRIEYVKLGTHVRIAESIVRRFVEESTVRPVTVSWRDGLVA